MFSYFLCIFCGSYCFVFSSFFQICILYVLCIFCMLYVFVFLIFVFCKKVGFLYSLKYNFVFVFCIFGKYKTGIVFCIFSYVLKIQIFSLELRTGKNHRQTFLTTSETWSGYPTNTRGCSKRQRASFPSHPYQCVASGKSREYCLQFCIFVRVVFFKSVLLK